MSGISLSVMMRSVPAESARKSPNCCASLVMNISESGLSVRLPAQLLIIYGFTFSTLVANGCSLSTTSV